MRYLGVRAFFAALILIVAVPAGFGAGSYQPPVGSDSGCVECSYNDLTKEVTCNSVDEFDEQRWTGCKGGYVCYYMPGAGEWCTPNCGTRCNIA